MLQDTRLQSENQSENQNQFLGDMFEGFLDNCLEPGRDFERETSLDDRLEQLEAFLILPILL